MAWATNLRGLAPKGRSRIRKEPAGAFPGTRRVATRRCGPRLRKSVRKPG